MLPWLGVGLGILAMALIGLLLLMFRQRKGKRKLSIEDQSGLYSLWPLRYRHHSVDTPPSNADEESSEATDSIGAGRSQRVQRELSQSTLEAIDCWNRSEAPAIQASLGMNIGDEWEVDRRWVNLERELGKFFFTCQARKVHINRFYAISPTMF